MMEYTEDEILSNKIVLTEDQYLLKIRKNSGGFDTGFFAKLTKKGTLPQAFKDWNQSRSFNNSMKIPITIVTEVFRSGWKLDSWRFGQSQNWASLVHPDGYTLEIYLTDFLEILKDNTVRDGELIGEFKWKENKLLRNE